MLTVVESQHFQRIWPYYWTEEERGAFCAHIAKHPDAGDVVAESGGVRKVRWSRAGSGKSGGVRVIYFTRLQSGEVVLLTMYAKAKLDTLKASTLKELRDATEKANQTTDRR
ncbi:MAG: type II toxin-antitoxin system RelE/ParE family toxin [Pseudomonadota bacterium]|nr:type II toxin-antitoxin system RelE/ParE family toxin [Pseudomonadota bacterium]